MLKVWVGLEARSFLQASADSASISTLTSESLLIRIQVERCVKYDQLSPNI
jgi:hypothetical protein